MSAIAVAALSLAKKGLVISNSHIFVDNAARDTYFTANSSEKTTGVYISVGTGFQQWSGTAWIDKTAALKGDKGDKGDKPDVPWINVKDYGAKGDGITNDTAAINNAIAVATTESATQVPTLYFPPGAGYLVNGTITVPINIKVIMDAQILSTVANNLPTLIIGTAGTGNMNVSHKLNVKRSVQSNWSSEEDIGIKLINPMGCDIEITQARGFTIGAQLIADGYGVSYNNTRLYSLINNKFGLDCTNKNSGWCNENLFFGGRFAVNTDVNVGTSRYGVRITSQDGSYINNNHNIFTKPSFELQATKASPGEAIPILIEHGLYNTFEEIRNESNSNTTAKISNASQNNQVYSGYGDVVVEDLSSLPSTDYKSSTSILKSNSNPIFISGSLVKKACYYDGATKVHIPGVSFMTSTGAVTIADNATIGTDHIQPGTSRAIGVYIDTSVYKRFVVRRDTLSGNSGRIGIKCYDSTGTVLTSAGAGHPYAQLARTEIAYTTGYGGIYWQPVDNGVDEVIVLKDEVKSVYLMMMNGSQPTKIRSFSIHSIDGGSPQVWTGFDGLYPGQNLGTVTPTAGTWVAGQTVYNISPVAGGYIGWTCITAGTPGTWRGFGLIASS